MNLKDLIEKYTVEGKLNFEEAENAFQTHVNGIVTKNVKKEVGKKEAEVMTNFISELGIEAEDIDGVKKWVGTLTDTSTDFQKKTATLESELEKAMKLNGDLSNEYTTFKRDTLISGLGVKGEEAEFLRYKFEKNLSDDVTFESQVEEYKKANRPTTHKQIDPNFDDPNTSSPLEALKKLRGQ